MESDRKVTDIATALQAIKKSKAGAVEFQLLKYVQDK
jgi:hypothetical protein